MLTTDDEKLDKIIKKLKDGGLYVRHEMSAESDYEDYMYDRIYIDGTITFDMMDEIINLIKE